MDKTYNEQQIKDEVKTLVQIYEGVPDAQPEGVNGFTAVLWTEPGRRIAGAEGGQIDGYDDLELFQLLLADFERIVLQRRASITRPQAQDATFKLANPYPPEYVFEVITRMAQLVDDELALNR